jgi:hypothetical protein
MKRSPLPVHYLSSFEKDIAARRDVLDFFIETRLLSSPR